MDLVPWHDGPKIRSSFVNNLQKVKRKILYENANNYVEGQGLTAL